MQNQTVVAPAVSLAAGDPTFNFQQIWPPAVIALGLGLTVAWASLLGYVLIELVELAF